MTTTIAEDQTLNTDLAIPGDDEVKDSGGGQSWRIANGAIVRGRKEDGNLETRTRVVGILTRVGIAKGEIVRNGIHRPIHKLELEFKTRDGEITLGANLLDDNDGYRPSGSSVSLAWCAKEMKANTVYSITASQGESWIDPSTGRLRSGTSYANLSSVAPNGDATPIKRPRKNQDAPKESYTVQFGAILEKLKTHSLYKEREVKPSEGGSRHQGDLIPWDKYNDACGQYGWPRLDQDNSEGFLSLVNRVAAIPKVAGDLDAKKQKKGPYATLENVPSYIWDVIVSSMPTSKSVPPEIAAVEAVEL